MLDCQLQAVSEMLSRLNCLIWFKAETWPREEAESMHLSLSRVSANNLVISRYFPHDRHVEGDVLRLSIPYLFPYLHAYCIVFAFAQMSSQVSLNGVRLTGKPTDSLWDIKCNDNCISQISSHHGGDDSIDGRLVTPGLCHPHIHLDKCFLLSHPKYTDLEINEGNFSEAMELTSRWLSDALFTSYY